MNDLHAVGMNDEQTECDACGRVELRGTVIVHDRDGVEVGRYGTTCASRILGWKVTRSNALGIEAARRSRVVIEIRNARNALEAGNTAKAALHVEGLHRWLVLHRDDEKAALAKLDAALMEVAA